VLGPLLVSVVEAERLCQKHPDGQARHEQESLAVEGHAVFGISARANDDLQQNEREDEPEEIGCHEHPADHAPAPSRDGLRPMPTEGEHLAAPSSECCVRIGVDEHIALR
jgi:hypothetical protein